MESKVVYSRLAGGRLYHLRALVAGEISRGFVAAEAALCGRQPAKYGRWIVTYESLNSNYRKVCEKCREKADQA